MENKEKLRIAFVIDVFDGIKTGGVLSAKRFVDQMRKDHEVIIISSGEKNKDKHIVPGFYFPFVQNLMKKNQFVFARPKNDVIANALKDVDVVHIQFPFFLGFRARKIAKEMGIPVVSAHHVQPENILYNIGFKSKSITNLLYNLFVKGLFNKSDAVICPSPFAQGELKRYGLTVPSYVISNGILPQFKPEKFERNRDYQDKFLILTVGRHSKEKRHDLLIEAISNSRYEKSIQLVMAGKGPLQNKLKEQGEILTNKPKIDFVSDEELLQLYNTADLYIHPSEVELESMTVLEAIGCGLPAIISNSSTSASKQFALNDQFLFKQGDSQDLTKKIDYLIENREILFKAKADYLKRSREFSFANSVKKQIAIYQNVVNVMN
jgi:1,2-diacylglycerol 3-alpha-glucosyltransferase